MLNQHYAIQPTAKSPPDCRNETGTQVTVAVTKQFVE